MIRAYLPLKTIFYGLPNGPNYPYRSSKENFTSEEPSGRIVELPAAVIRIVGLSFLVAGGFLFIKWNLYTSKNLMIKKLNKQNILAINDILRLKNLPTIPKLVTYYEMHTTLKKLKHC
ncbi:MAG: hypothetical protein QXJ06_04875 [Candidatus Aenigmatarchaeota archaeon]